MLVIYRNIFQQLESSGIKYCSWKNNHLIQSSIDGHRDIDLLVAIDSLNDFELLVVNAGFVNFVPAYGNSPCIKHYYYYDSATCRFAHLHVYYRVITGESLFKNYHFPIERELFANAELNSYGIREASYADQLRLHAVRYFIKASSLPSVVVLLRDRQDYVEEHAYLDDKLEKAAAATALSGELYEHWPKELGAGLVSSYFKGLKVRKTFKDYRIVTGLSDLAGGYVALLNVFIGRVTKSRGKRNAGLIVALSGLDGSGKSSGLVDLHAFAKQVVGVRVMHFGRPKTTLVTLPVTIALTFYKYMKRLGTFKGVGYRRESKTSLVQALRLVCLSIDRRAVMRKANNLRSKGYLVLLDRCPIETVGCMDAPKIMESKDRPIIEWLRKIEVKNYSLMTLVDHTIVMKVSMETAIARNDARVKADKETAEDIMDRFEQNSDARVVAYEVHEFDTERDLETVRRDLRELLWKMIKQRS